MIASIGRLLAAYALKLVGLAAILGAVAAVLFGARQARRTPSASSACAEPSRCYANNWMPRLTVLVIATSLLTACGTARSDGPGCLPISAYSREFLARAVGDLEQLPAGSAVEHMLADYHVM